MLFYIYVALISICFLASVFKKELRQDLFPLYFAFIFFIDIFFDGSVEIFLTAKIYSVVIFTLFWGYYFQKKLKEFRTTVITLGSISIILELYFLIIYPTEFQSDKGSAVMAIFFILMGMLSLFYIMQNANTIPINKKRLFWIALHHLIWSVFFIFRMVPAYFLDKNDEDFLILLNTIFQYSTVFSYIILFYGLIQKHEV